MNCTSTHLSYSDTGYFSDLVRAYIDGREELKPFYKHPVSLVGMKEALAQRAHSPVDRELLVAQLNAQYESLPVDISVRQNIGLLSRSNTFTVCTAHQPAIFTGNLFFVYKILHTIRLADRLATEFPGNNFVPVYYMGSEDADLDELGCIFLDGEKITWDTQQAGAIGRMKTTGLEKIIRRIEGEFTVQPHGRELVDMLKECYLNSANIQEATLKLVNRLFGAYGLIVLVPDNAAFKKAMIPLFRRELFEGISAPVVEATLERFPREYEIQANPRPINLFYLRDDIRARIEREGDEWKAVGTGIAFNREELERELSAHPERFSPNVILRGVFQESILPNIAFIGGGGELAYWLELKELFAALDVPYPVLVLRNSFLFIENRWKERMDKLRISVDDIFGDIHELLKDLVKRESEKKLSLAEEITHATSYYDRLKAVAGEVDDTLTGHVAALETRAIKPLKELEKKLVRAEKKKFSIQERQLSALKKTLFPNDGLQERVDNFMPFYARWGRDFIHTIFEHSLTLEQRFTVIIET